VLQGLNVTIYEHTRAKSADGNTLSTVDNYKITFDYLIIATHFPFLDLENFYFNSFKISYGYGLVAETSTPIPENISLSGYDGAGLSIRNIVDKNNALPLLLFGGLSHGSYEQKDMAKQLDELEHYAGQKTVNEKTLYAYRAQDLMTADSLPFIGYFNKKNENYFVASGFNKYGMANGVLSSMIISDLAEGKNNMYKEMLDPDVKKELSSS
jgi:Glycine/D-amino acid oxidases (deaminating)